MVSFISLLHAVYILLTLFLECSPLTSQKGQGYYFLHIRSFNVLRYDTNDTYTACQTGLVLWRQCIHTIQWVKWNVVKYKAPQQHSFNLPACFLSSDLRLTVYASDTEPGLISRLINKNRVNKNAHLVFYEGDSCGKDGFNCFSSPFLCIKFLVSAYCHFYFLTTSFMSVIYVGLRFLFFKFD